MSSSSSTQSLLSRFEASMILSAVGDAVGYRRGKWEFLKNGPKIHQQFNDMGRFAGLHVNDARSWPVSDDTVMHLATAETLTDSAFASLSFHDQITLLTQKYDVSMNDMNGRGPGLKCIQSLNMLHKHPELWHKMAYDKAGGGCGGSMRAMCIGLRYFGEEKRKDLIRYSVESGRITHNHVNGFMGAVVSAAFTAFAVEQIPPRQWGRLLLDSIIPQTLNYVGESGRDVEQVKMDMKKFESKFLDYMQQRNVVSGETEPKFPEKYGVEERDQFYNTWSFNGWAGASGDDSVIISYDAVLGSGNDWEKLVERGVLHYGDNDSTGAISCAWFGALYGYPDAQKYQQNWKGIEYEGRLKKQAELLYQLATK